MTSIPLVTSSPLILTADEADVKPPMWWKIIDVSAEIFGVSLTAPEHIEAPTDPRHWRRRGRVVARRLGHPLREYVHSMHDDSVADDLVYQLEEHNPEAGMEHLREVAVAMLMGIRDYCARRLTGDPIEAMPAVVDVAPDEASEAGEASWGDG